MHHDHEGGPERTDGAGHVRVCHGNQADREAEREEDEHGGSRP